jgi:hypothetical protein
VYWRKEILAYFYCRLTNPRTEGFNGKAKLVIRRAYGYKSSYRPFSTAEGPFLKPLAAGAVLPETTARARTWRSQPVGLALMLRARRRVTRAD